MSTIKKVAQLANVSVATVSRVLNAPQAVSEQNRKAVQNAIDELRYVPNVLGRNLRQQHTKRIMVVLNSISNQFYSRVLQGIEDRAKQDYYTTMIATTGNNKQAILSHLEMLSSKVTDGAIFLSPELAVDEILQCSSRYPIVCACEPIKSDEITCVTIDNAKASYDATNFLLDQGKHDLVLITADGFSHSSDLRTEGFRKALCERNIPFVKTMVIAEGFTYNAGKRAAQKLLNRPQLPQAVFAIADNTAIGLIKTLHDHGVCVPKDIAVMGFDNTALSEVFIPSISTVAQPQYEMGYMAMGLLIDKIEGRELPHKQYLVKHRIIVRNSV